jgi:hypothetical protein
MHDYHEGLPGFSAAQILHDGCSECEARAKESGHGLAHLDRGNFFRAYARAVEWNRDGLLDLARAEIPLLTVLWELQIKLESYVGQPIGTLPLRLVEEFPAQEPAGRGSGGLGARDE